MRPIRIALDPGLRARHGPELGWAWRTVLTGIGRSWEEVGPGQPCDIAHVRPGTAAPEAVLQIRADPERWDASVPRVLDSVHARGGLDCLAFAGEPRPGGVIGLEGGRTILDHDAIFDFFWLATAQAEDAWARNRHGHPQPAGAVVRDGLLPLALASEAACTLDVFLLAAGMAPGMARWPDRRRAAVCLSHDVDYPEVIRWLEPARVLRRQGSAGLRAALDVAAGRRSTWQFGAWLELEERFGARSAFYFCARKGSLRQYATSTPDPFYDVTSPRFGRLLRHLASEGAEVGLHASYRAWESAERFGEEKARLETAAGRTLAGNRHHYLHLDPVHPEETLLMHERLGLEYDSTLAHDMSVGWRNGISWPFAPFHRRLRRAVGTLQLPMAWMDQQVLRERDCPPGEARARLAGLVGRTRRQGGCLVANIHEYVYDDALFPGWSSAYAGLLEDLSAAGDFWFATPVEVARHWRARSQAIERASCGLGSEPPRMSSVAATRGS
jgi:hypothetical protein